MSDRRWSRALGATLASVVLALGLAACGSDDDESGGGGSAGGGGKSGGTISVLHTSFPDFLDPALSYTVDGWEALHLAYPGLVGFTPAPGQEGAKVQPALAQALPEITNGGKTYEFTLREGLKFSNNQPLRPSDFKASIERIIAQESQGAGLGYTNIVGAAEYGETKKGGISGIEADDAARRVTINLVEPRGAFLFELAIPFAGVVPKDTPAENQTKDPPPGAGRYVIQDVKLNRSYKLVKNKNFSPALKGTVVDSGKPDTIDVEIAGSEANAFTRVSRNDADFMVDNPPAERAAEAKSEFADRFGQFTTNSTFYFFMNTEAPPFDNLKVRQAVNHAIDPEAINRVQGGVLAPANNILPPGVPGYQKTKDLYPTDLAKARQLVEESGTKGADITVWGNSEDTTRRTVEYYADVLNKIGFNAKLKIIAPDTYFVTIGERKNKPQTGWANWYQDYPHPADFIDILLNPSKVVASGNNNYSYNAKDTEFADGINAASREPELTPEVEDQWAALDKEAQEKAYWGIYGNRRQSTFFSERMDFENCKGEHSVWTHDWGAFCLK